jgi:phage-related minor tail protein
MATAQSELQVLITAKDEASPKLNSLSASAKTVGLSFVAVGGAITTAMGLAIKASSDAEVKIASMDATLGAMGKTGLEARDKILQASQAVTKLGFDDEEAAQSIAKLFQRTGDLTQSVKLNALAMDLARTKHIDLSTASNLVGMVMSGNSKILKQYGIDIKDTAGPVEALGILQERVSGQASNFANTFAGQSQILSETFSNLQEQVGSVLLPILTQLLQKLVPIVEVLIKWTEAHPELTKWIVILTAGLGAVLLVMGSILLILPTLTAATTAFGVVLAFVAANPIVWIIGALVALGVGIYMLITHWETIKKKTLDTWNSLSDSAKGWVEILFLILTGGIGLIVIEIIKHWDAVKQITSDIWGGIVNIINSSIGAIKSAIDSVVSAYNSAKAILSTPLTFVTNTVSKVGTSVGNLLGRASGGDVMSNTPYVVGETGPEIFVPNMSGSIIPNGGMGSGITVNINGGTYLSEGVALEIGNMIVNRLKNVSRITR